MTDPKAERRSDYPHLLAIPTRWRDVDTYSHVNNAVYYAYFDTVINEYLVRMGGLDYTHGDLVGFAVETHCTFLAPIKFPDVIDACLRVAKLGNTSCRYEIGLFKQGDETPCAVGYFVHVFVDRTHDNRPTPITGQMRKALAQLQVNSMTNDIPSHITTLLDDIQSTKDAADREDALQALVETENKAAVPPLIALLDHDKPALRADAAWALGQFADVSAVEPLIAVLAADDVYIRGYAVSSLGNLGDGRAVQPLIDRLTAEDDPIVTDRVIDALGKLGDARAIEPLMALFESTPVHRPSLAIALGRLGHTPALEPIKGLLKDDDPAARARGIVALHLLEATSPLVTEFADKDALQVLAQRLYPAVRRGMDIPEILNQLDKDILAALRVMTHPIAVEAVKLWEEGEGPADWVVLDYIPTGWRRLD